MSQCKAVTVNTWAYTRGSQLEKLRNLDDLLELTGWNRD
jgi:hypothetical protein